MADDALFVLAETELAELGEWRYRTTVAARAASQHPEIVRTWLRAGLIEAIGVADHERGKPQQLSLETVFRAGWIGALVQAGLPLALAVAAARNLFLPFGPAADRRSVARVDADPATGIVQVRLVNISSPFFNVVTGNLPSGGEPRQVAILIDHHRLAERVVLACRRAIAAGGVWQAVAPPEPEPTTPEEVADFWRAARKRVAARAARVRAGLDNGDPEPLEGV